MIPIPKYPYLDTFVSAKELFADPIKVYKKNVFQFEILTCFILHAHPLIR